jgi:hypothetical protein
MDNMGKFGMDNLEQKLALIICVNFGMDNQGKYLQG